LGSRSSGLHQSPLRDHPRFQELLEKYGQESGVAPHPLALAPLGSNPDLYPARFTILQPEKVPPAERGQAGAGFFLDTCSQQE